MITELLDAAQNFDSPSVSGLLRSAPDLQPLIGYINSLYYTPESGESVQPSQCKGRGADVADKTVEILPDEGADEECDKRTAEVRELENTLESILRRTKKEIE
jgi:DNA mismatch repair protein MSH6